MLSIILIIILNTILFNRPIFLQLLHLPLPHHFPVKLSEEGTRFRHPLLAIAVGDGICEGN